MNDLDILSEKILKQIIKHNGSLESSAFNKIKKTKKYSIKELADCLKLLEELGYISYNKKRETIDITFKGKQYFLLKNKYRTRNIIFSFIIPIIVALITAYFTAKFTTNNEVTVLINTNQII